MFQIDAMSREPVYEQIIHQVEQFILTDVLQPEAQIPSVRSVSMTNSINPRTILKAYTELDARGLIQSVPGKGYYVCAGEREREDERPDGDADGTGNGWCDEREDHCLCGAGVY